ncbi:MAG: hypothetical protein J6W42_04775 [Bacteroidaceae bacterium]|nr:hypothetical protein [Bacteroidaceae bacterium]
MFGGGRGFSGQALTAGVVCGNVDLTINGGTILGSVFGGGRLASVGTGLVHPETGVTVDADGNVTSITDSNPNAAYGTLLDDDNTNTYGNITINISGGTIGATDISGNLVASEFTIGDVFAGGKGSTNSYKLGLAKNTNLYISGGTIMHSVYGGGELGSLGMITGSTEHRDYKIENGAEGAHYNYGLSWPVDIQYKPQSDEVNGIATITITGGRIGTTGSDCGDVFGGSKGKAASLYEEAYWANVYETHINVDYSGNPNAATSTDINITTEGGKSKLRITDGKECVTGSVYGGSEDGHIIGDTYVTLTSGLVGHCLYGGGKGKGTYTGVLKDYFSTNHTGDKPEGPVGSLTAGKVYGNAYVTMLDGHVVRNIFGGGNLGSMGIGNYAGGTDDYSLVGYGELPAYSGTPTRESDGNGNYTVSGATEGTLWDDPLFRNSGKAIIRIENGTVGYFTSSITTANMTDLTTKDDLPTGNVFGGCRGQAAPNYYISPRYKYFPEYFFGYVNETQVIIGKKDDATARPRIYGSVYGGGQDGHVRRDANVIIYNAEIGLDYDDFDNLIGNSKISATQFRDRGNVYGAGSGTGQYKITKNNNEEETGLNYSSGSVTCNTSVTINGNTTVYQNVYGGGSLASVGPPDTYSYLGQGFDELNDSLTSYTRPEGFTAFNEHKSRTSTRVIINGGNIGNATGIAAEYGGNVYGASRGNIMSFELSADELLKIANSIWTDVDINGGQIAGNVFGGGEMGAVKQGVNVNINGGTMHDVYGGGSLAKTNTTMKVVDGKDTYPSTTVYLDGGTMHNVYGGGLGSLKVKNDGTIESDVEATSGNVSVFLNQSHANDDSALGAVVDSIFGANNLNGTPLGHILVHVYATQNPDKSTIGQKFHRRPVQGENDEDETPQAYLQRLIDSVTVDLAVTPKTYISQVNTDTVDAALTAISAYETVLANTSSTQEQKDNALAAVNKSITEMQNQFMDLYDVSVVFGGGNLAPYIPANSDSIEVIIDGCQVTSIRQVYGGSNAASVPATYVVVYGSYEIEELFGGGNGRDPYTLFGNTYLNPGANVGYYNYTDFVLKEGSTNIYEPVEKSNARTKEDRAANWSYEKGSGVATTQIRGGKVHAVFGGSNEKGNIRTTALSVFEDAIDDCPVQVDETYGGGKNAPMDGKIELTLDCVKNMEMIFGGAKNADINSDIVLNITNGTYRQVFGGNNTGGALNGAITVNIKEEGCQPIEIDALYGGGYLAPYSIYGYETDNNGRYIYYQVDENNKFIKDNSGHYVVGNADNGKIMPLDSATFYGANPNGTPSRHPHINIISATRVDNIYGGGYKAKMVGSPYINVNMEEGRMSVYKKTEGGVDTYYDVDKQTYNYQDLDDVEYTEGNETKHRYYKHLDLGYLRNIYGGGFEADVDGSTYINIGTGSWITLDNNNVEVEDSIDRRAAIIKGDVFGGGDNADVTQNTHITIGDKNHRGNQNLTIEHNIYGGGKMGSIGDTIRTVKHDSEPKSDGALYDFALSWPVEVQYREGTGNTYINIYDGRIGTTGADDGDVFGGGKGQAAERFTEARIANVNNTYVKIDYDTITPDLDVPGNVTIEYLPEGNGYEDKLVIERSLPAITGSVYGGSENGHVIGDTHLDLINGVVGHVLYGGGKGKGKYQGYLYDYEHWKNNHTQANFQPQNEANQKDLYSLTAGKVYGNTYVTMKNGHVMRNVFGGGNLGSVGIGNYAGGKDDYSEIGYGELPPENNGELWSNTLFTGTGNTHVTIEDGIVGFILKPIAREANEEDEAYTTRLNNTLTPNSENYGSYTLASINEVIRTLALKDSLPTGNVFGGCRGQASANIDQQARPRYKYLPDYFLGYVNETEVRIGTATTHPVIMGSVYGGGQDGHVRRNAVVIIDNAQVGIPYDAGNIALLDSLTVTENNNKSENPHWVRRGNVFGAGSGIGKFKNPKENEAPYNYSSGSVTAATSVHINDASNANSDGTVIYGNIYGGGAIASVGPPPTNQEYIEYKAVETSTTGTDGLIHYSFSNNGAGSSNGKASYTGTLVTITGGTIGNANTPNYGGDVFGASRGNASWDLNPVLFSTDGWSTVNITGGTVNGNVFGGGEAGMVKNDATVSVSGTLATTVIGRDLFGGGDQADVKGNTSVSISGGWIKKSVYGGGNMGSIGDTLRTVKHDADQKPDGALYNFALSWPVDVQYREGTGNTHVSVTGGRIGITGKDYMQEWSLDPVTGDTLDVNGDKITSKQFKDAREDNGDIYGGGKGITADRYIEATIANVNHTLVEISYGTDVTTSDISSYVTINDDKVVINDGLAAIHGSVYGGGENGHVIDSTHVIINAGLIGHSVYGGGKGKDTYQGRLKDYFDSSHSEYDTEVSSITAGKVYGNTRITMNGGYVLRNIYGGGNLASVGKGNYSGGTDDYMVVGYGELPSKINGQEASLWDNTDFINSGITTVAVNSGTVGYFDASSTNIKAFTKDDLPTGNVFGSCRGQAAPNYFISPRYEYFPEYFFGYVNETRVTIGNDTVANGPRIYGSVYGGGQDGHVRRDASVTVNKGTIGLTYDEFSSKIPENTPISSTQFKDRGNVYGAGSGIGQYEFKTSLKTAANKDSVEVGYNYSSGSVTGVTKIQINSGTTIYQNVYGGGSLASVGPPMTGAQTGVDFDEFNDTTNQYTRPTGFTQYSKHKSMTTTHVIINGGTIGEAKGYAAGYGGNVFGASRGNISNLAIPAADLGKFATTIWTKVEASNGHILGNVFGGGESGAVKRNTMVIIGGVLQGQQPQQQQSGNPVQGRSNTQQTQQSTEQPNTQNGGTNGATESLRNTNATLRPQ